jgi:hypothetical protein
MATHWPQAAIRLSMPGGADEVLGVIELGATPLGLVPSPDRCQRTESNSVQFTQPAVISGLDLGSGRIWRNADELVPVVAELAQTQSGR